MPPRRDRQEQATSYGVSSRVVACRQRLRRTRAGHKSPGTLAEVKPLPLKELGEGVADEAEGMETGAIGPDLKAAGLGVEGARLRKVDRRARLWAR
jgi:hypothetical protein